MLTKVKALKIEFPEHEREKIRKRMENVFKTGMVSNARYVEELEEAWKERFGFRHAVAVSCATAGLEIVLKILDVKGKDVFMNANTFYADVFAIERAGGHPVLVDVREHDSSLNITDLKSKIEESGKPGVILATHIGGYVSKDVGLMSNLGIPLVEDCAHAQGSILRCLSGRRYAGSFGTAGVFSFSPIKLITGGEGGLIVTGEKRIADEARMYREWGKAGHDIWKDGYAWKMSEWNAIIALTKLESLDYEIESRGTIVERYIGGLKEFAPMKMLGANYYRCIAHLEGQRREVIKYWMMSKYGVEMPGACYQMPIYKIRRWRDTYGEHPGLPGTEDFCKNHLVLPCYSALTHEQLDLVIEGLNEVGGMK